MPSSNTILPKQLEETIQSAPYLEFKLGLLEIHLYELDESNLLAVPRFVGKTIEQTRAVMKIQYEEKKPQVEVTSIEPEDQQTSRVSYIMGSLGVFVIAVYYLMTLRVQQENAKNTIETRKTHQCKNFCISNLSVSKLLVRWRRLSKSYDPTMIMSKLKLS